MRLSRSNGRAARSAVVVFVVITLLAACSGQAGSGGRDAGDLGGEGAAVLPEASDAGERTGRDADEAGGPAGQAPNAAPIEQRIIKTGEVTLEADNVASVLGRVRAMADALGGYVGGSQAGTLEESASITLRVPADRFEELIARLQELDGAEVVAESTTEQDVTGQVVDLEARIRNLEASEASYRALVERAERIEDILAVQMRLDEVRGQIEQLQAQLETIEGQADLSTLTVLIVPRGEPVATVQAAWDPGAELQRAVAALVGFGQGLLNVLIWFAVVWIPVLVGLALVGLIVWRIAVEVRRRWPAPTAPRETEPMR